MKNRKEQWAPAGGCCNTKTVRQIVYEIENSPEYKPRTPKAGKSL